MSSTLWNQAIPVNKKNPIAADIVLPKSNGPFPAVIVRTPYVRGSELKNPAGWMRLVAQGYVLVSVDMRGRNDSEGEWLPFVNDADDAYQVIEWVAAQSWCTGKVGMVGMSYEALTQWWTVARQPPHLRCIAPISVGAAHSPKGFGNTGIPVQYWLWWFNYINGKTVQYPGAPCWEEAINHLPLRTLDQRLGLGTSAWQHYVNDEIESGAKAGSLSPEDFANINIPVLVAMGWWDDQTTMATWVALQQAHSAKDCRLLIGGWDHGGNLGPSSTLGGVDMSASVMDTVAYVEQFLALHLKDEENALAKAPRCRIFHTGKNSWEDMEQWPQPEAVLTPIYLSSDGDARGLNGNGKLSFTAANTPGSDTYTYDPNHPARDVCNLDRFAWSDPPLDHRYLHRREDILLYDTEPLRSPLSLSGRIVLQAFIASDCVDTDVYVGINDVHPDGRAIGLFATNEPKGGLRLRYRNGTAEELLTPHQIYPISVDGIWVQHTFKAGHRLRITVYSGDFPFAARNAGSGLHWAEDTELFPQTNTLYHGGETPSHVLLPIVPAVPACHVEELC